MMDESTYQRLADAALKTIVDAFEDVDTDKVDVDTVGDVVTLTLPGGRRCVVNTQRPARQIWLAANARAWHFSWDAAGQRWLDDRGRGDNLFATIARIVKDGAGVEVAFG